jgi:hypothetical protein
MTTSLFQLDKNPQKKNFPFIVKKIVLVHTNED